MAGILAASYKKEAVNKLFIKAIASRRDKYIVVNKNEIEELVVLIFGDGAVK